MRTPGPAGGFGAGQPLDVAPGGGVLLSFAADAAGDGDRFTGACDDELTGIICALDRAEAAACSLKHAALAAFLRRRPYPGCAVEGAAELPAGRDEFAGDEIAQLLAEGRGTAEAMLDLARDLEVRLPGTKAAFRAGTLRHSKAQIIAWATAALDPGEARAAEDKVLGRAGRLTPGGLRSAIARAVMEVAPDKARKRREQAAKDARVQRWAEDSGNAALAGRELPPDEVLAVDQRISWWARQLKKAGLTGSMDELRARAYLDLLLDKDSRPTTPAPPPASDGTSGDEPGGPGSGGSGPPDRPDPPDPPDPPAPAAPMTPPGAGVRPAGFVGRLHLTVPLATLLGLADRPGEIPGLGPVDPWLARDLARAAAANPKTTWCLSVTDGQGHAIGHGCARLAPDNQRHRPPRNQKEPQAPGGPDPPDRRPGQPGRARSHLHPGRPGRATRRVRHLAVHHRHRRPAGPAVRARPDRHPDLRPPVRGRRARPGAQAAAPGPDPARHMHRPDLPAALHPGRLRAQHPLRSRRPDLPVQRRP